MQRNVLIVGAGSAADDAVSGLRQFGYGAEQVKDPAVALERLLANGFDLVLVGGDGPNGRLRLCAAIRERCGALPILLLGAAEPEREAIGSASGPDDYVVREFDLDEIRTRARSLIQRAHERRERLHAGPLHECGPLRLDPGNRRVSFGSRTTTLTAIEYKLLGHLARSPGRASSRVELLRAVWGYEHEGYGHTLTTHVNRLRAKLEKQLGAPRLIETVRGLGYRFDLAIDR